MEVNTDFIDKIENSRAFTLQPVTSQFLVVVMENSPQKEDEAMLGQLVEISWEDWKKYIGDKWKSYVTWKRTQSRIQKSHF